MIKGHTKIELTNVRTGERQVVEKDNLVTNAVAKYFEKNGHLISSPSFICNPLADTFFGGLLLFQNPIDENVNNYDLPCGNPMVGNAIINYSSLDVPEFGSFNADESAYTVKNGVITRKYVYDFATSKANGSISTICLTNPYMGYYGTGNRSGKYECKSANNLGTNSERGLSAFATFNEPVPRYGLIWADGISKPLASRFFYLTCDFDKNCAYYVANESLFYSSSYSNLHFKNGYLEMYKVHVPFNRLNLMCYAYSYGTVYDKIRVKTPDVFSTMQNIKTTVICHYDGIYLIVADAANGSIAKNANFYVWKIASDLETSELFEMVNNTGYSWVINNNYNAGFVVVGDYLIGGSSMFFKWNLKNPSATVQIPFTPNTDIHADYAHSLVPAGKNNAFACFAKKGYNYPVVYRIDVTDNKLYLMNGVPTLYTYSWENNKYFSIFNNKDVFYNQYDFRNGTSNDFLARNPFTLSTINNLPEPVTKTSDMTMKITYTLTSKIEPEE